MEMEGVASENFGLKLLSPVGCLRVLSNTAALQMLLS